MDNFYYNICKLNKKIYRFYKFILFKEKIRLISINKRSIPDQPSRAPFKIAVKSYGLKA